MAMVGDYQTEASEGFYRWRIFVFGVDVTDDVFAINIPRTDARAAGTATISLANAYHRYTISASDIPYIYQGEGEAGEDDAIATAKRNVESVFNDSIKQSFLRTKVGVKQTVLLTTGGGAGLGNSTDLLRWRFASGLPIIHPGDPVTIFEMDPITLDWWWSFAGKVRIASPERDPSGRSVVTLTCVDALGPLEQARTAFNPSIIDASIIATARDKVKQEWFEDGFSGISLPEYVRRLVFGYSEPTDNTYKDFEGITPAKHRRYAANGLFTEEALQVTAAGTYDAVNSMVGYFGGNNEKSTVTKLRPDGKGEEAGPLTLESWQIALDWRVNPDDLTRLASFSTVEYDAAQRDIAASKDPTTFKYDQYALITALGTNPQRYPVDRGRVMQLYPAAIEKGGDKNVLLQTIIQGPSFDTEYKTRMAIIYDILSRIDHCMYATPKGDVVIEMPLHHFDHDRWGEFESRYTFINQDDAGMSQGIDTTRMVSVVTSTWVIIGGDPSIGDMAEMATVPEAAISQGLVGQFGVRLEKAPIRAHITTQEAAKAYANMQLARLNGELDTRDANIYPRMGLGPNRPAYDAETFAVGCIRAVNSATQWNSSVTMKLSINHMRRWQGGYRSGGGRLLMTASGVIDEATNWATIFGDVSATGQSPTSRKTNAVIRASVVKPTLVEPTYNSVGDIVLQPGQLFDPDTGNVYQFPPGYFGTDGFFVPDPKAYAPGEY